MCQESNPREIEVTEAMIDSGAHIIASYFSDVIFESSHEAREGAARVFRAMYALSKSKPHKRRSQTAKARSRRQRKMKTL